MDDLSNELGEQQHIPAIDDDPEPATPPEPEQGAEPPAEPPVEPQPEQGDETKPVASEDNAEDGNWFPDNPDLNVRIAQYAKEIPNLDPNDPQGLKTLRRMAEKDLFIDRLKAERGIKDDGLTEFERKLGQKTEEPEKKEEPRAEPKQEAQPPTDRPPAGSNWRSWTDAPRELAEAWSRTNKDGQADPDYDRIAQIENAAFARRMDAFAPALQEMFEEMLEQRLGGVLPQVQKVATERAEQENLEFALSELERTEGYSDVRSLLEPRDGPPITVNGEQVANTPFAQAVKEAPFILEITRQGKNPIETDRLTLIARLRAAKTVLGRREALEQDLKKAADAGQAIAKREQEGRVRHDLNRGSGTGQFGGDQPSSYVEDLMQLEDGGLSGL